ncbi:MAG: ATP-binding cassette domain-containing protein, partial [Thiobacillaceae bacterium]
MTTMTAPTGEVDAILRADRVTKAFGGLVAVREVDLEIPRGSIISIIGPNGAGKTTFFNVIVGILDPTSGFVSISGRRMVGHPVRAWLEPIVWVLPSVILGLLTALIGATTASDQLTALGALAAILGLVVMFLAAIVRPVWYRRLVRAVGIFRSATPNDMVHAGIGRTFQNIRLFANMSALENVLVGMHTKLSSNMVDALLSTSKARREEAWAEGRAEE